MDMHWGLIDSLNRIYHHTRRKDYPKRLCHNNLNCPQQLIFSRFSVIVDNFSRCGIVIYSSFSSSVIAEVGYFYYVYLVSMTSIREEYYLLQSNTI